VFVQADSIDARQLIDLSHAISADGHADSTRPTPGTPMRRSDMSLDTIERAATEASPAEQQAGNGPAARLQQAIQPVRAQLSTAYSAAQEKSKQAMEGAEAYIHRSPFRSIAYAAGVAAVLGAVGAALLGRRNGKQGPEAGE
jgi:ElaB/YqjD/DUF883 family membrane-anchored ribosome-binding protein